jgi:integrase
MKNNGKSNDSIKSMSKLLNLLNKHIDLSQPEQVKHFIAQRQVSTGTKRNLTLAYDKYAKYYNIQWQKPKYRDQPKPIRIPTKERLSKLIAEAGNTLSIKLQLSMETGLRPVELCNLKTKDADTEQRTIYPTTAKYGARRTLKITPNLAKRLDAYITKQHRRPEDKLFRGDSDYYGKMYRLMRNRLAERDPTLKTIRLYDF